MVILVSDERTASAAGQRLRQGTDGMVQMGTGGTNADANHPCRQAQTAGDPQQASPASRFRVQRTLEGYGESSSLVR